MFNKHINSKLFVAGAMLTAFGLSSCIDNDYDLDNVDMTIGSNVDLTLPACSTGEIQLKNIIDLEDDGVVQLIKIPGSEDSMYVVREDGKADIDPINIGAIVVDKPRLDDFNATVDLDEFFGGGHNAPKKAPSIIPITVGGVTVNLNVEEVYRYTLEDGMASTDIHDAAAADVSSDICSLEKIEWEDNGLTLKLKLEGVPSYFKRIHLDGFHLTLPEQLIVSSCTVDGKPVDLTHVKKENGHQTLTLTADADVLGHSFLEPVVLKLSFKGANIVTATADKPAPAETNVVFDATSHNVQLTGTFSVTGNFRILMDEMDKNQLVEEVIEELKTWPVEKLLELKESLELSSLHNVFPQSLHFTGENRFADDIKINKVSGEFKHEVGAIDPIKLDDLPDFLNDEEVVLDLDNPMLFISTSTNLPAEAKTTIKLVSKAGDKTVVRQTNDKDVVMYGSKVFWMANREETKFIPERYSEANLGFIHLYDENNTPADVTGLIKTIPDQIDVEVSEVRLVAKDLDITKSYDVNVEYEVYAPLAFGEEFMLVYQDSETDFDLGDDLDDLTLSDDAVIEMTADVVSTLPTSCTLNITPLDKNKNVLDILKPISVSIAPAKTTPIKIELAPKAGHNLNEVLHSGAKQLDGIQYKAVLDHAKKGEVLTDDGNLVLKNIKLHVKAGVAYDAN